MVVHHFKYVTKLQNTEPSLEAFYISQLLVKLDDFQSPKHSKHTF